MPGMTLKARSSANMQELNYTRLITRPFVNSEGKTKKLTKIDDYVICHCCVGDGKIGVRWTTPTMQRLVGARRRRHYPSYPYCCALTLLVGA